MDPIATPNKPSGLPRLSKLPVLSKRPSFAKPAEPAPPTPKPDDVRPRLQKRPSLASLQRTTPLPSGLLDTAATPKRPASIRTPSFTGTRHAVKAPVNSRMGTTRPSSRGNQQRVPPPMTKPARTEDEENQDQLGSLDGFRAASRQGFHDESPMEFLEPAEPDEELFRPRDRTKSRPSLSDRTIESLQGMPSTPKERRRSSFFSPLESPMGPPPRPTSALSRNGSSSRPGTSDGLFVKPTAPRPASPVKRGTISAKSASRITPVGLGFAPASASAKRRSVSTAFSTKLLASDQALPTSVPRSPSPSKQAQPYSVSTSNQTRRLLTGSKTLAARPTKARPTLGDVFAPRAEKAAAVGTSAKTSAPAARPALGDAFAPRTEKAAATGMTAKKSAPATRPALRDAFAPRTARSTTPVTASKKPTPLMGRDTSSKPIVSDSTKSSAALREQIAAAKVAAVAVRKEKGKHDSPQQSDCAILDTFNSGLYDDPFNQAPGDGKHILRNRIKNAWTSGKLNIAAMGLKRIPDEVMRMYDAAAMEEGGVNWAEVVDIKSLLAADNVIDNIDEMFIEHGEGGGEEQENQFGGLEMLDLHGNQLSRLPMGLRKLERVTSLNLSRNALDNACLDIISQITSLKELRLAGNNLQSSLPSSVANLSKLQTLDLHDNKLLALPEALRELTALFSLDVSKNQLTSVPMSALQAVPLSSLDVSENALISSLFLPGGTADGHPTLRSLKLAHNNLAALSFSNSLDFPHLETLDFSANKIAALPAISGWMELVTLRAADNKLTELPAGFENLRKLKCASFTGNELRFIPPSIARMENLETLLLASNPLQQKKYLTMNAEDIKRDLRGKLEPEVIEGSEEGDQETVDGLPDGVVASIAGPGGSMWQLKGNGVLDLSSKGLGDEINDRLGSFLRQNEVKELRLQGNKLTVVPPALWLGYDLRVLDLSKNSFDEEYLLSDFELPVLRELNLSSCGLKSLEPLVNQLCAPSLQTLIITANRLTDCVPEFRATYPTLTTLLAADNKFASVSASSLRGFQTVNLNGNALNALDPGIGFLWDEGLKHLEVGSNAFRVPNHTILGKGTMALCRWLRDRLPAEGEGGGN